MTEVGLTPDERKRVDAIKELRMKMCERITEVLGAPIELATEGEIGPFEISVALVHAGLSVTGAGIVEILEHVRETRKAEPELSEDEREAIRKRLGGTLYRACDAALREEAKALGLTAYATLAVPPDEWVKEEGR
jgi:hypothetical protein